MCPAEGVLGVRDSLAGEGPGQPGWGGPRGPVSGKGRGLEVMTNKWEG